MAKVATMQFCAYCGAEMGVYIQARAQQDTCGKRECERWAQEQDQQMRDAAHEELDRDMGWGRW